jgi:hypothetical protein
MIAPTFCLNTVDGVDFKYVEDGLALGYVRYVYSIELDWALVRRFYFSPLFRV